MRDGRRRGLAAGITVLMHGSLFLSAFTFIPGPLDVDIELEFDMVEVDLVDPNAIQGTDVNAEPVPPEPEPPPSEPPTPDPPAEEPKTEEPKPEDPVVEEGPKRDLGQKKSRVHKLGPPSANYHVLLSTRNIRKLPFGKTAMETIAPLPDFEYLVKKGGFDPLKDFDHILIASSNLRSVTQTFLAVDYKLSRDAVKAKIETAVAAEKHTIEWKDHDGILSGNPVPADGSADRDPRHFVLLKKKVAVLVRPEFLAAVTGEEVGEEKTAANFVSELTKLRRYSRRIPTAGMQFVANDLHAALKRKTAGSFELPNDIEFTMEAQKDPEFHMRFKFASGSAAKDFVKWWNGKFRDVIDGNLTAKIMFGSVIDDIEVERKNREVTMWGELSRSQIELILTTSASQVKKEQARLKKKRRALEKKRAAQEKDAAPKDSAAQ
ncbi:MAG: hypothetical protein AAGA54_37255 [Myxococcota bacterium]